MSGSLVSAKLETSLENADRFISRSYIELLKTMPVISADSNITDIDISVCGSFYKVSRLVINKEESFIDKLITIANVAFSTGGTLAAVINSDGISVNYYLGLIAKEYRQGNINDKNHRNGMADAFEGAVTGNFAGSELKRLSEEDITEMKESIFGSVNAISTVSGLTALRNKDMGHGESFVQGMENFINSVKGKKYTIIMFADPLSANATKEIKTGYEMIYTNLSAMHKSSATLSRNESSADTISRSESMSESITEGISKATSRSTFSGKSAGVNAGINITPFGIGGSVGVSAGKNWGSGTSESDGKSHSDTHSTGHIDTTSNTKTTGSGKSIQFTSENRSVRSLMDKIDIAIKRLDMCKSYGAFDCASYILSDSYENALAVAGNYNAIMRGEDSFAEAACINVWEKYTNPYDKNSLDSNYAAIEEYIEHFSHPRFSIENMNKNNYVTPASVVSGKEIALQIGFPKRSVNGLTVMEMSPMGRNIRPLGEKTIDIGELYYMGKGDGMPLELDLQSLASHTFITGSTGSGKSNTIYNILSEVSKQGVKFLVIEPAKGEYKHVFGNEDGVAVYGTNPYITPLLKINPFKFPKGIHVYEHIDRLVEIFNVCWPMYAAMPAVLKDSIERAYVSAGWDLDKSINKYSDELFPTFADVLKELNVVVEMSAFSEEVKDNYIGSLSTRIKSLTNGLYRRIFDSNDISDEVLFNSDVIVDLSRVGSMETKSMIMGILVMRLQEYRMSKGGINSELKHITVLEEAHNILKRTTTEQMSESANLMGKAVEMLSNTIAEIRTYGEGFIIADQAPGLLDMSAIRNTNTKIIMRLPDEEDRKLAGSSAGLNEQQIKELAKLPLGVAAVYQNNWLEPVLCKIKLFEEAEGKNYVYRGTEEDNSGEKNAKIVLKALLCKCAGENLEHNIDTLSECIIKTPYTAELKAKALRLLNRNGKLDIDDIKSVVYDIAATSEAKAAAEDADNVEEWYCAYIEQNREFNTLDNRFKEIAAECILREEAERFNKPKDYVDILHQYLAERKVF